MKFGLAFANTGPFATAQGVVDLAAAAEANGIESVWTVEHVIWPSDYSSQYPYSPSGKMPGDSSSPIPDPMVWLAFLAAHSSTLVLGTGIVILPERNPLVFAKEAATLDQLSGGRFQLGIGVGWLREEFEALGIPWEKRGKRTDEYIEAMRALWAGDDAAYDGDFAAFHHVTSNPKPVNGSIPIVVGGHSAAAARRAGRLGDGFFPGRGSIAELAESFDIVRQTAADNGRDPEAIELTAAHPGLFGEDPVGAAQELRSIGVSRTIIPAFMLLGSEGAAAKAEALNASIISPCTAV